MDNCKIEIVGEDFVNHWAPDVTHDQHHADETAVGSSMLKTIFLETPAHFHAKHVSKKAKSEETDAMRIGQYTHMALLEPSKFRARYKVMPDFGNMRTNAAKEKKESWLRDQPQGAVVLDQEEFDMIMGIVEKVLRNPVAMGVISGGIPERTGYWRHPETSIKCKIRPDIVNKIAINGEIKHALNDFKTARSAKQMDFYRSIGRFRYDFQMAFYCDGYREIEGFDVDFPLLTAAEKSEPYASAIYQLSKSSLEAGRRDYNEALVKLRYCLEKNWWPAYEDQVKEIDTPFWALSNQDDSNY